MTQMMKLFFIWMINGLKKYLLVISIREMTTIVKPKCIHCNKTLPAFGSERKNGKESFGHWKNRTLHKSCFKVYHEKLYLDKYFEKLHLEKQLNQQQK